MKCLDLLNSAKARLQAGKILGFDGDAEFLLCELLNVYRSQLRSVGEVSSSVIEKYNELISRRLQGEPMDSLLGFTEFLGLNIPFSQDTLSPRQETEIMVDCIIRENSHRKGLKILDLCTGSGCIGLALKKYLDCEVTLSDISDLALIQCEKNAKLNGLNVKIQKGDLFENVADRFDVIVSNPPYISSVDISRLEVEVREYDPLISLDGGADGLDFYRKIASKASDYLRDNGLIYLEFGIGQGGEVFRLLSENFEDIEIVKDYSGIDRYIKGKRKNVKQD